MRRLKIFDDRKYLSECPFCNNRNVFTIIKRNITNAIWKKKCLNCKKHWGVL